MKKFDDLENVDLKIWKCWTFNNGQHKNIYGVPLSLSLLSLSLACLLSYRRLPNEGGRKRNFGNFVLPLLGLMVRYFVHVSPQSWSTINQAFYLIQTMDEENLPGRKIVTQRECTHRAFFTGAKSAIDNCYLTWASIGVTWTVVTEANFAGHWNSESGNLPLVKKLGNRKSSSLIAKQFTPDSGIDSIEKSNQNRESIGDREWETKGIQKSGIESSSQIYLLMLSKFKQLKWKIKINFRALKH